MTETEKIQSQIIKLLMEKVHVKIPSATTDLMATGLLDSMGLVELIAGIEEQFGIQVPMEEISIDQFQSVARMADFVCQQRNVKFAIPNTLDC